MKNIKAVWWLIQINAIACFFLLAAIGQNEPDDKVLMLAFAALLIAALLEYVAYHSIYKVHLKNVPTEKTYD